LRERAELSEAELEDITARLARMGPWARTTLELIAAKPETRAGDLAEELGEERLPFKANVRKLKELGLTESLEVGYRLSPRGRAYLAAEPPTPV
jgi:Mn-dependent DtxR family transcriptional regulator